MHTDLVMGIIGNSPFKDHSEVYWKTPPAAIRIVISNTKEINRKYYTLFIKCCNTYQPKWNEIWNIKILYAGILFSLPDYPDSDLAFSVKFLCSKKQTTANAVVQEWP